LGWSPDEGSAFLLAFPLGAALGAAAGALAGPAIAYLLGDRTGAEARAHGYTRALSVRQEVVLSPIEHAIRVNPEKVRGCDSYCSARRLLCLLKLGENPAESAVWCGAVLQGKTSYSFGRSSELWVQRLERYPQSVSDFVGTHALVFCEHHGIGEPVLENLIFRECVDPNGNKTIIYRVGLASA